ncbi:MAG TPA: HAD family hydrolase [Candidatus Hydrogenedentes bacterium]|nr:HAD family hydrolase [Candidatus Hydrogenedentota bacterium]HOL75912.1 HAD family hydrolase [Candidatus Hydrogenedentota bacterium]HPO85679.1 HAD family hydrolase [Candidatus Hydrogenedentota bacterium]
MLRQVDAVFFDFGGTLAFEPYTHVDSFYAYLVSHKIETTREEVQAGIAAMEEFDRSWHEQHGGDGSKRISERFWFRMCLEFARHISSVVDKEDLAEVLHADHRVIPNHLYEDTIPTLEVLHRAGICMGVISNWDAPILEFVLHDLRIRHYFRTAVSSRCAECEKPAPKIFLEACRRANVSPEHSVMVGDNPAADVQGALGVGMMPVWINRNGTNISIACPTIYRLSELPALLSRTLTQP